MPPTALKSFKIDDSLADVDRLAIEVTVTLADDRRRWCFFMTPAALGACGDFVPGTDVRVHHGVEHMFVVSRLDQSVIQAVLEDLEARGELESHTLPLD